MPQQRLGRSVLPQRRGVSHEVGGLGDRYYLDDGEVGRELGRLANSECVCGPGVFTWVA